MELDEQKKSAILSLMAIMGSVDGWVGGDAFRVIFPREGWNVILAYVGVLAEEGAIQRQVVSGNGGALYERYRLPVGGE